VPVYWWHGDADPFVPIDQAYRAASLLSDVEFVVRPGESHLGEFAAADQVLTTLAAVWQRETGGPGTIVVLPVLPDDLDQDDDDLNGNPAEQGPATIS
jgi:fermentation-respiration switch protein FrsA (DUF1100 family)